MPLNNDHMNMVRAHFRLDGVVLAACTARSCIGGRAWRWSPPRSWTRGMAHPGSPTMPMVQFSCKNCGYVTLFGARTIGLPEPLEQEHRRGMLCEIVVE